MGEVFEEMLTEMAKTQFDSEHPEDYDEKHLRKQARQMLRVVARSYSYRHALLTQLDEWQEDGSL